MTTSYDTRNNLALQYLSRMFGVGFRMAVDIRREQCKRCNEVGAITTCRVVGDSDSTTPDQIECCISCLDATIRKANTELRSGADVHVEVAARLAVFENDIVELRAGTKCMRTREPLTAERYVVVDRPVAGFLLVRPEGDELVEPSAIRFANVSLICAGCPVVPDLQHILGQMYGAAWVFVAVALLVDDLLTVRRARLAADDALLDNVGSAIPAVEQLDDLGTRLVRWRQEEIENRPMPDISSITKEDRA